MYKQNILIVTASIGSGHNKAAEAISNEMKIKYPDAAVHTVDFMSTKTAYLNGFLKAVYLKMLDFMPNVYDFLYNFTGGRLRGFSAQRMLALAMKHNMEELVRRYQADIVICTHPFPCAAAAYLKRHKKIDVLLACVITDFSIHQMWVYKNIDLYFVATEEARSELVRRGIAEATVRATGIPIDRVFGMAYDRPALLTKFELQPDLPIALIMGGGLGLGGVKVALQQLEALDAPLQILVVTGANASLWSEIKKCTMQSKHKIEVWGYSNNVQELMAVASFLISKPGALTICEALAMELPMLLHEPIPGPETENAAYVAGQGAAIWIRENKKIGGMVEALLREPAKLEQMRQNAHRCKKTGAAAAIVSDIREYNRTRQLLEKSLAD